MTTNPATLDQDKLNTFVGSFVSDLGAVFHAATVLLGDRLGLYAAMADSEPVTADALAERTGTDRRYVAEWLSAQAASGYVELNLDGQFRLPPEQALALSDEQNPFFAPGGLQAAASALKDVDLIEEAFRTGRGVAWGEHDHDLFQGTERFFRPNYIGHLTSSWIPSLDGMQEKLADGARVVDIGCGHGASTILMAEAFPASTFVGFDPHEPSVRTATERAAVAGVGDRCSFEAAHAESFPGDGFDFAACFDCLHDMGDPVGAATHIRQALAPDGIWMIVEPYAGNSLHDNLTPVGRVFYAASTMICTPNARSQGPGMALGAQAGQDRLTEVLNAAGFAHVRRTTETPFNLVLEARA
jgi:SAM-dependent methyltransferase